MMMTDNTDTLLDEIRGCIQKGGWLDEGERNYFDEQRGRYAFMLRQVRALVPQGKAVLDVGSHLLHFAMAATACGYDVSGADVKYFASHPINLSRQKESGVAEVRICELSSGSVPYGDASFDAVIFAEALEHLNFNPLPVAKELWRVLKPGGIAIVTTPNALRLGSRLRFLRGRNVFADLNDLCWGQPFAVHYREYSLGEVTQLLEWAGFDITVREQRYLYPTSGAKKIAKRVIEKLAPSLAGNLVVIGRK
jgi:2-polyprenyl-3-methyl-5-hydroxy-6-metoxy-1,4-benzoquinol methylase